MNKLLSLLRLVLKLDDMKVTNDMYNQVIAYINTTCYSRLNAVDYIVLNKQELYKQLIDVFDRISNKQNEEVLRHALQQIALSSSFKFMVTKNNILVSTKQ